MKSAVQAIAEVVKAMLSMMISNDSADLAETPGSVVKERLNKQSHRGVSDRISG